ncbi:hypothetical protein [Hymenobacter sp. BT730]|uniref:hypothetical protein n=1 Tax=Hymenobacter sp. BT730 TaxID=3063332 RepID=UPI0026E05C78|nr:hypothetical protein [Hymenobacter sp. BT730]
MKKTLFMLSCGVALTMASCSQEKTTETATTNMDGAATTTTTTTTTTQAYSDEAIERRADRIAADVAAKMKLDDATRTKVRTVYVTRGKRLGEVQQKYAADTTGMAAEMRTVYDNSDLELKQVFPDPTMYEQYETNRVAYYDNNYMDDSDMSTSASSSSTDNTMDADAKSKTKYDDGSKIKVKSDGDVKMKDAEGNKTKMDADDGTVKDKPEDGDKSVIK